VGTSGAIDPGVATLLPLARWLGYAGLVLGLGVPLVLATCWPGGWPIARLRRAALGGLAAVAVGGVLLLLAQGPYAAEAGLGSLLDTQLIGSTLDSTYGRTLLGRIALAVLLAVVLARGWRRGRPPAPALLAVAGVLAAGLVVAVAAVGHPVAGSLPALAVAVSAVHVAAMSGWLGGLVALFAGALRDATPTRELDTALPRWSRLAGGCIGALVLTGVLQAVREVGSFSALVHTSYGWVLLAKLAVVLVVLIAALVSRDWVEQRVNGGRGPGHRPGRRPGRRPGHGSGRRVVAQAFAAEETYEQMPREEVVPQDDGEPPARLGVLRRSVLVELAGAVVVLALSAVLVSQYPAKATVAMPVEVTLPLQSASGTAGTGTVQVSLDPARPGPSTLQLYLFDADGQLAQPQQIAVSLTEVQQEIGPLVVELAAAGPGHYVADPVLPSAGTWTLTVTVRLDEFTAVTASTVFPVR
jgi:copper transport protein